MRDLTRSSLRAAMALALAVGVLGHAGVKANAGVVYDQPPTFPGTTTAWTSTFDPVIFGNFYTTYDNFSLASSSVVTDLTWQGFSFDSNSLGGTSNPVLSFNVSFYADASGKPGVSLSSQHIAFTSSVAGTTDYFANGKSETIYNYSGSLTSGFAAAAGTSYWLSVQAVTNYPAYWSWTSGTGGDGASYQVLDPRFGTFANARTNDRAFSLSSSMPVPEPSSLALCGLAGIAGLAVSLGRRN
jgi:hypothetical protein